MSAGEKNPSIVIIAGPNGAGKSTAAPFLLRDALQIDEFVNADTIAQGLCAYAPESVAFEAGRIMLRRLRELAEAGDDFAFETTLASRSFAPWLRELGSRGYRIHLLFLSLPRPEAALARVARRVAQGGHDVPEEVVRRRFFAGVRNFFQLYRPLAHHWRLYDAKEGVDPILIAQGRASTDIIVKDPERWEHFTRHREPT